MGNGWKLLATALRQQSVEQPAFVVPTTARDMASFDVFKSQRRPSTLKICNHDLHCNLPSLVNAGCKLWLGSNFLWAKRLIPDVLSRGRSRSSMNLDAQSLRSRKHRKD